MRNHNKKKRTVNIVKMFDAHHGRDIYLRNMSLRDKCREEIDYPRYSEYISAYKCKGEKIRIIICPVCGTHTCRDSMPNFKSGGPKWEKNILVDRKEV